MEDVYKSLDEVVHCIQNSKEYQTCLELQKRMDENEEIKDLVNKIKKYQKQFVNHPDDEEVKTKLKEVADRLHEIPLYNIYLDNLSIVNEKIQYVKDSLNEYFDLLLNKKY